MMVFRFHFALLLLLTFFSSSAYSYQPWSEQVFTYISKEYGKQAEKRTRYLHDLIMKNQDLSDREKLVLVNSTLNHLPWIADQKHWKQADYWATPMETLATFGGDCEDIAIAKFLMLRHLAIPARNLRLAYVKIKKSGEAHMVLLFLSNPSKPLEHQKIFVLDNFIDAVKLASERKDLLAVYAFSADNELIVFSDNGKDREVKGTFQERKLKKLDELKLRMEEDRERFKEINDGRYLFER